MSPDPVDPIRVRDLARLSRVHPDLQAAVIRLMDDHRLFVVEGVRTVAQQQARWQCGRNDQGAIVDIHKIVTKCDGIHTPSNHQLKADGYGHAVDLAFRGPVPFPPEYSIWEHVGIAAEKLGLTWGGRFPPPLVDLDHFELPVTHAPLQPKSV